jgi:hypothetical protein
MLSIRHPSVPAHMSAMQYGLQPFRDRATGRFLLAIKVTKEAILAARLNQSFGLYVVPAEGSASLGLIVAFFDDHDEPIVIRTPLGAGDEMAEHLVRLLSQDDVEVYFFDEHNRELMGVLAVPDDPERLRQVLNSVSFPALTLENASETLHAMQLWFSLRTPQDDQASFRFRFVRNLYADDFLLIEASEPDFQGGGMPAHTSLEREEPGPFQERDVARLLRRVFPPDAIFLNAIRDDTGRELCDVLVVADSGVLAVQAKDNPNTEAALRRSIARKQATSHAHLKKAVAQLKGTIKHLQSRTALVLRMPEGPVSIDVEGRPIRGLIVLNEMFDHDFPEYSAPVLALAQQTGVPNVVVDYPVLHMFCLRLADQDAFIDGIDQLFEFAASKGEFPRPRYLGPPA